MQNTTTETVSHEVLLGMLRALHPRLLALVERLVDVLLEAQNGAKVRGE